MDSWGKTLLCTKNGCYKFAKNIICAILVLYNCHYLEGRISFLEIASHKGHSKSTTDGISSKVVNSTKAKVTGENYTL